jgi:sugar phosphate isomerase/epimerase
MTTIDRRTFVKVLGAGTAGVALGCSPKTMNGSSGSRKLDRIGIQLYTVRNDMEKDFEGTLSKIAGIGYKEVEFAGYFGHSPADVRAILNRLNITAPSAHGPLSMLTDNWQKTIDDAKVMGHEYLIVAYLNDDQRKSLDDYRRHADLFNSAGETARKSGIKFGYHNHDFEFKPMEGKLPYDLLLERTDPNLVKLEMDLFWITKGGQSPLTYFSRYPGRIELVHVKDMDASKNMVDVGKGTINWAQIFAERDKAGIRHFFVEHDNPPVPLDSAKASYNYLSALTF